MPQWLTIQEACLELRLGRITVLRMLREKTLLGVRVSTGNPKTTAQWRIFPPSEKMRRLILEREEHLLHVPLLSSHEVAAVLKVKPCTVRFYVKTGHLKPAVSRPGQLSLFTAAEVRRFLWYRERYHRKGRKVYSAWLRDFLTAVLEKESAPSVQQLESLVAQVMSYLPREEREPLLPVFWKALEQINEVLRRVREARAKSGAS